MLSIQNHYMQISLYLIQTNSDTWFIEHWIVFVACISWIYNFLFPISYPIDRQDTWIRYYFNWLEVGLSWGVGHKYKYSSPRPFTGHTRQSSRYLNTVRDWISGGMCDPNPPAYCRLTIIVTYWTEHETGSWFSFSYRYCFNCFLKFLPCSFLNWRGREL